MLVSAFARAHSRACGTSSSSRTGLLQGRQDLLDGGRELGPEEQELGGRDVDAVEQGLAAEVGVDQGGDGAELGGGQPRNDVLGAVLHVVRENVCRYGKGQGKGQRQGRGKWQ